MYASVHARIPTRARLHRDTYIWKHALTAAKLWLQKLMGFTLIKAISWRSLTEIAGWSAQYICTQLNHVCQLYVECLIMRATWREKMIHENAESRSINRTFLDIECSNGNINTLLQLLREYSFGGISSILHTFTAQ